jgi:hypothetical protein
VLACSAAVLLGATSAETAPAANVKTPWQLFGRAKTTPGQDMFGPAWAANRVWIIPQAGDGGTLASARVSGRTLGSFAARRLSPGEVSGIGGTGNNDPFVDERLVVRTGDGSRPEDGWALAPLLPDGQLGPSAVVTDDLFARAKEAVPKLNVVGAQSVVRLGDRLVWSLGAGEVNGIGGGKAYQLVCCNTSGAAVDLTAPTGGQRAALLFVQIAVDAHGRIWLAWLDHRNYPHAVRGVPRILELDPSSLVPRSKPLAAPGLIADGIKLACADSCRVVAQTEFGDIVSWAPAERSTTPVASGWRPASLRKLGKKGVVPVTLLAAAYRSGRLVVAYRGQEGKTQYVDTSVLDEIRVARGDARGARSRVVDAILVAKSWPPSRVGSPPSGPVIHATFTPRGLLVTEWFAFTSSASSGSPVIAAFMPLGG